jgi:ATP/maltotriose-dependent transcriptional regulator MalT
MEKAEEAGQGRIEGRSPHEVFDYFASEIFEKSNRQTRDFLLGTSLLPFITTGMAERLTGAGNPEKILERLARNNFFTVRRRGIEPLYQYHPLFREFLMERTKGSMPKGELVKLEAKAASVLEEGGYAEDAAGLFASAGQWDGLIGLIMKQAMAMLMQGRSHVLEGWIRSLPGEIFNNTPWLQYWMGACRLPFDPKKAEGYFKKAFDEFNALSDPAGLLLSWSGVVDSIFYGFDNVKRLDPWIDMLGGLLERSGGFPSIEVETRVVSSMYIALSFSCPDHPGFERWQERALALADESPDINYRIQNIMHYVTYCWVKGDTPNALLAIERLRGLVRSSDATPFSRMYVALAASMQANYSTVEEDYEALTRRCLKRVDEYLEITRKTGVHAMDFQITGGAAWSCVRIGDFVTAEKYLARMSASPDLAKPFNLGFYHYLLALIEFKKGRLQQALQHMETAQEIGRKAGGIFSDIVTASVITYLRHELGDHEGALRDMCEVRTLGRRLKNPYYEYMALTAEAHMAFDRGRDKEGLSSLKKSMSIGRERGLFNSLGWRQGVMAGLCVKSLEAGIETEYVK